MDITDGSDTSANEREDHNHHDDHSGHGHQGHEDVEFAIFVDEVRYEVNDRQRTGAEIKSLAGRPPEYQLFLERPGYPDQLIDDQQSIMLKNGEHFHTIPPAQFG